MIAQEGIERGSVASPTTAARIGMARDKYRCRMWNAPSRTRPKSPIPIITVEANGAGEFDESVTVAEPDTRTGPLS